jgi:Protein of unknown function (DUF2934)/Pentapeptide repeats (8 copies)
MNSRLSRLGRTVKERALPVWKSAALQFERALQWLRLRWRLVVWVVGISIVVAMLIGFAIGGGASWYDKHHAAIAPLLTLAAGVSVAAVALVRHFAQTDADRQRRISESFSKAVEQLGSEKLEVRLGGIYSLERISKESPDDYWTVMENLTAFVRERSRRNDAERLQDFEQRVSRRAYFLWEKAGRPGGRAEYFWADALKQDEFGEPPATDIVAVLTVIMRRNERSRERESTNAWRLNLSGAVLKGADLKDAHLERAILKDAHLEGALLGDAHLERATLSGAHLQSADLVGAQLEWANLCDARLEGATLSGAHLEAADLVRANLKGAYLLGAHLEAANLSKAHLAWAILVAAHLEAADLSDAVGLSTALGLSVAYGDALTRLPAGISRPADWPPAVTV